MLAGCPRALERRIGRLLDNRVPIAVKRVFVRGSPMIRLSFQEPRGLLLLVDPRTFAPAEVRIARQRTGWSHLAPGKARDLTRPGLRLSRRLRLFVKEDA